VRDAPVPEVDPVPVLLLPLPPVPYALLSLDPVVPDVLPVPVTADPVELPAVPVP